MARLVVVQKSQKAYTCGKCHEEIPAGSMYFHWSIQTGPRSSRKSVRCFKHKPRPSELTGNQYRQMLLAAQEGFEDGQPYTSGEEMAEALRSVAEVAREVSEMLAESSANIVDGFGHETYQSDELQERSEALEQWADEIEDVANDADAFVFDCDECDGDETEADDDHDHESDLTDALEEFADIVSSSPE